jgi:hypothetical protein
MSEQVVSPIPLSTVLLNEFAEIVARRPSAAAPKSHGIVGSGPQASSTAQLTKSLRDLQEEDVKAGGAPSLEREQIRRREVYATAHDLDLSALCLSGGGIRSASFALGLIEGLAEAQLLHRFDYMSTVSGGGYIGSWLSTWLKWEPVAGRVLDELKPNRANADEEPTAIRHLRAYSSYLTPKLGLMSADTWTAVAIVIRNLLLNWLILVPSILLLVVAIKIVGGFAHTSTLVASWPWPSWPLISGAIALLCIAAAVFSLRYKLRMLYTAVPEATAVQLQFRFLTRSLGPAVLAGACFAWLANAELSPAGGLVLLFNLAGLNLGVTRSDDLLYMLIVGVVVYLLAALRIRHRKLSDELDDEETRHRTIWDVIVWIVAAIVTAILIWFGVASYSAIPKGPFAFVGNRQILVIVLGMPWFILSMLAGQITYVMLRSYSRAGDFEREWLGRAGGWYVIAALGWTLASSFVLLGSPIVGFAHEVSGSASGWLTTVGAISGAITAFLGKSSVTPGHGPATNWTAIASNVALAIAGPLFAVILVILLSSLFDRAVFGKGFEYAEILTARTVTDGLLRNWLDTVIAAVALGVIMIAAAVLVNVNRFSLHALYRNRLIRAFLGGPHIDRTPDGFTGFDLSDNIRVKDLWPQKDAQTGWRPFHVINIALNLASGRNLAWQQRKAESFTVTPLQCGSANLGYRKTCEYGDPSGGITLGTAMAISGAAVSPNMGYHSSPSIAILLTLFNVRLGWWLGNPGVAGARESKLGRALKSALSRKNRPTESFKQDAPWLAFRPLFAELFGLTNEDSPYVYLSDGGHFENLGLYEMVRRRCRWIIVSDAGQDGARGFADLGNAVRKIWIDLGVRIIFPKASLLMTGADETSQGVPYIALGTILYVSDRVRDPSGMEQIPEGRILYIKPTVRGDEGAADIIAYRRAHVEFPHQSTGDQWFDEPQLEAYRALGYTIMSRIVAAAGTEGATKPLELDALFRSLETIDPRTMQQHKVA